MNPIIKLYETPLKKLVDSYAVAEGFTLHLAKEFSYLAIPCFYLAKTCKKAPQIIAEELAQLCNEQKKELQIEKAESKNGYLNIHLPRSIISTLLQNIVIEKSQKNKTMVVFIS